jgi:hypothetical protein
MAAIANDFETVADNLRPQKPLTFFGQLLQPATGRRACRAGEKNLPPLGGQPPRNLEAVETKDSFPSGGSLFARRFRVGALPSLGQNIK